MKEETLYTIDEVAEMINKSRSWVTFIINKHSIPAKIEEGTKGLKKFWLSMTQIHEVKKHIKRKYRPRTKSIKPIYASNEVSESQNRIDKLNKEIIQLRNQLRLNQEQLTLKICLLDVLNESDFKLSSQVIENMVGQIMQWHYKVMEAKK